MSDTPCKHEDFSASVDVNRLEDTGRFSADVRINCANCGIAMRFLGLPVGLDINGAAVNLDGTEARLGIHPLNEPVLRLPKDVPSGFKFLKPQQEVDNGH